MEKKGRNIVFNIQQQKQKVKVQCYKVNYPACVRHRDVTNEGNKVKYQLT